MTDLLVLVPTLNRPANCERLLESAALTFSGRARMQFLPGHGTLTTKVNAAAAIAIDHYPNLMFIGDDHVFETADWDARICEALAERPGWAWPDDVSFPGKPECFAVSSAIVAAHGWMILPTLKHYYADNVVQDLSNATGLGHYLPEVKVPHLRDQDPEDDTRRLELPWGQEDREAYLAWRDGGQMAKDAATAKRVSGE